VTRERDDSRSVPFDRAAEYYDRTRGGGEDVTREQTERLSSELGGRGRVLEIGVGTGLVSLPLQGLGLRMVGVDLSAPMLAKLVEKGGGAPPFPLVRADGTRLPFADDAFGGVVMRWVLHLVPAWRRLVAEVVRVVRPGGVVLVNHGGSSDVDAEIRDRMQELVGRELLSGGLESGAWRDLRAEMRAVGAEHRELVNIVDHSAEPLAENIEGLEAGKYSWTWGLGEGERRRAAREVRAWAEARFGPLDAPRRRQTRMVWHAYDLPSGGPVAPPGS
jgi:ubiquinone/menaquinone biosynthesis C-methylase UbiE